MTISKKDLAALKKEFKAIGKKLESVLKAIEKSSKTPRKAAKKKPAAARTTKPKAAQNPLVKQATAAKNDAEKVTQETATEQILALIKRSKDGVDVPTLKKKTGFDDKKVRNIVFRAGKQGKIKKSGRGVYVSA